MGTRGRQLSSDEEGAAVEDGSKRVTTQPASQTQPGHYDIYAIPSTTAPHPSLHTPGALYQSVSLLVVNRAAGLTSGLGILYALSHSPTPPLALIPYRDPGFFLGREPTFDPGAAVLLGWVEEEKLGWLDGIVAGSRVPRVRVGGVGMGPGGVVREWVGELGGRLEMEGVLSNPDLLLSHFWR